MSHNVTLPRLRDIFPEYVGQTRPIHEPSRLPLQPLDYIGSAPKPHPGPGPSPPSSHTDDRRFACEVCGKRFSRPSALETHMNSHTGLKPHACSFPGCGKSFSARSNMQRHMRTHGAQDASSGPTPATQHPRNDRAQAWRQH